MFRLQVSYHQERHQRSGEECDEGDELLFRGLNHGCMRAADESCWGRNTGRENHKNPAAGDDSGEGAAGYEGR